MISPSVKEKRRHIMAVLRGQNVVNFGGPSNDSTQRTEGTCEWICSTPNYKDWQENAQKSSLLWISGGPGCGKTFLSNFLAKKLNENSGLVCKYSFTGDKSTPLDFLRSMLTQALAGDNHELCRYVIDNWDSTEWNLSWDSLWSFWAKTCEGLKAGQIFWVIDALDECDDPAMRSDLLKRTISLLQKLNRVTDNRLCFRVLLTSRPEVWRELPPSAEQETAVLARIILENESAIEDDIRSFIRNEVQMLAKESMIHKKDIEKLQTLLCKGAGRTFIWPQLTLQAIRNDPEPYNEATWDLVLQSIPSDLEGIYEKLLFQLSGKHSRTATTYNPLPPRTKKLLQFVLAGQEFFTVSELNVLLALGSEPDTISFVEQEAEDIGPLVERVYGSFLRPVTDAEGVSHVRLFHDTARKHLLLPFSKSKYGVELRECHLELAKGCISYLWLDDLGDILSQNATDDSGDPPNFHPLLQYASLNWAYHVRESEELMSEELLSKIIGMYKMPSQRYRNWTRAYWSFSTHGIGGATTTPLQMCAHNGHCRVLRQLLQNVGAAELQAEIDQKDTAGNTALHYAVDSGRAEVIGALLEFGADTRIRNNPGLAALHKAVIANEEQVVLALLSGGGNVDIRTDGEKPGRTVLHLAAESGLQSMVELLVKHGANIDIVDSASSTAAKIAFDRGQGAISRFLDSKQLDSGITDLDRAIIDGDEERVRNLVEAGASLTSKDNRGSTPLHRAARGGVGAIMKFLMGATSDGTEIQDDDGMTPLHVASRYGHTGAIEILLTKHAQVDALSVDRLTPLHEGVLSDKKTVVDRLLDAGANQSQVDRNGRTPLFIASSQGYDGLVELLLRKDKTGNLRLQKDDSGQLPIHIAAKNGHLATLKALLNHDETSLVKEDREGHTPLALAACGNSKNHAETVKLLIQRGAELSHKQLNGATPLHQAAQCGNELSIKYLLGEDCNIPTGEKVDIDGRNSSRATALSLAAAEGHESVVELFLKHGAQDLGKAVNPGDRDLLSWVAGHGMTEALKSLLMVSGIIVDSIDGHYRTPLSWAAGNGHSDVVTQLLDPNGRNGPLSNVDSVDTDNRTPLSWAAASGHEVVVKVLLSYGADPTIKSRSLGSPVTWAATKGHSKVFSTLMKSEKINDEHMFDYSGNPLLALAAENGKIEIVTLLLDHSSPAINNPNAPKKTDGNTPLILAAMNGHDEIVRLLLSRGADIHLTTPATKYTALLIAIESGCWFIAEMLIEHDQTVLQAKTIDDKTPLYLAVREGHYEIVEYLLNLGCDPNASSPRTGNSILHATAEQGHFLILGQVLQYAGHYLTEENLNHQTPLTLAAAAGHELIVTMLLDYARAKAIPNQSLVVEHPRTDSILTAAVNGNNAAVVKTVFEQFPDDDHMLRSKDRHGWTPLTRAAASGRSEILRQLLRRENVNEQDPGESRGPLLWASCFGDEEIVRLLLTEPGLEISLHRYAKDNKECNSLWGAVAAGQTYIVKLLLEDLSHQPAPKKQWLNATDRYQGYMMSPLQLAVYLRHVEIVKLLLKEEDVDFNAQDNRGNSVFLLAIQSGDGYLVRTLAETLSVDITLKNNEGHTALMLACGEGHFSIAEYLLREWRESFVPVDASDFEGQNALSHAIKGQRADAAIVQLLLDSNASIIQTFPPHNRNLLILAAARGSLPIVKLLCETNELDIEAVDNEGFSALNVAAQKNMGNMVRLLLERGADPNSRSRRSKRTPLMEAAINGCAAAMRELMLSPRIDFTCLNDANRSATWFLLNGANNEDADELCKYEHLSSAEMFLEFHHDKLSVNEVDVEGVTALHLLTSLGEGKRFELRRLLQLKADLQYQSWNGLSAYHLAAMKSSPWTLSELLAVTRSDETVDCKDLDHATPLSFAAGNSIEHLPVFSTKYSRSAVWKRRSTLQAPRCQMVRMLIDRGANVNSTTLNQGRTPLMFAAHLGWDEIVALLLEKGAVVDKRDKNYSTALSLAVEKGWLATVQCLLEANAAYSTKDKTGATMVIIAAKNGHLPILRFFVSTYNMDVTDRDRNGRTALSYAAELGHTDIVHYLLEQLSPAEVDVLDRQDQTALVWACKTGHCIIISLLEKHNADPKRKDKNGRTPFSHAAEHGQMTVLRQLLVEESQASLLKMLEWKDDSGRTALSWAAEEGQLGAVRLLLKWGADPLSSDKRKMTPRMFALDKGHLKTAKLLASDHAGSGVKSSNNVPQTREPSPRPPSPTETYVMALDHQPPMTGPAMNTQVRALGNPLSL